MKDWFYQSQDEGVEGKIEEGVLLARICSGELIGERIKVRENEAELWISFNDSPLVEKIATCVIGGEIGLRAEMLPYGDKWVLPEHKEEFLQLLQENPEVGGEANIYWGKYRYKDPMPIAIWALLVLGVMGPLMFIAPMFFWQFDYLFYLYLICPVILMVFMMLWYYRVSCNAHVIKQEALIQSPGVAVVLFFVPFISLFMPYAKMREIFNVSHQRPQGYATNLVNWWWVGWIVLWLGMFLVPVMSILGALLVTILSIPLIVRVSKAQRLAVLDRYRELD